MRARIGAVKAFDGRGARRFSPSGTGRTAARPGVPGSGYWVAFDFMKAIRSAISSGFFSPTNAILVPLTISLGFSR